MRTVLGLFSTFGFLLAAAGAMGAGRAPADGGPPQVGDPAPPFALTGSDGRTHRLADYAGRQAVVLAWFPMAFTAG